MHLYILRHAEAEATIISDHERRLTRYGHQQAASVGRFCSKQQVFPEVILTSPVVRARQTSEAVMAVLKRGELIEVPWMACGMNPENILQELQGYKKLEQVMIVGHEPDLSSLIAMLLDIKNPAALAVSKAALVAIELQKIERGCGVLKWFVPAELIS